MLAFLLKRLLYAAGTIVLTAFFAYGLMRFLRPDLFGGEPALAGTWHDVTRALLHLDFGESCMFAGCPPLRRMWHDGAFADLYLLAGGLLVGLTSGVAGGVWCAARPRSWSSRALESAAMLFLCTPAYVVGFFLLLAFAPDWGWIHMPYLFDVSSYQPPGDSLWDFTRTMLVPWLVVGAPLGASALRLTLTITLDTMGEPYVDTARAKGLPHALVVRRHAGPASMLTVASLFGASAPLMVTNMVLVEFVFAVPGFFRHLKRALGQAPGWPPVLDVPTLQAIAVWSSVLIVALSLLADVAIGRLDPRIRTSGGPPPG
jgi:peptide/nickel transport system permease protein